MSASLYRPLTVHILLPSTYRPLTVHVPSVLMRCVSCCVVCCVSTFFLLCFHAIGGLRLRTRLLRQAWLISIMNRVQVVAMTPSSNAVERRTKQKTKKRQKRKEGARTRRKTTRRLQVLSTSLRPDQKNKRRRPAGTQSSDATCSGARRPAQSGRGQRERKSCWLSTYRWNS